MIEALLRLVLAVSPHQPASFDKDVHYVFPVESPPAQGLYRVKPTIELSTLWKSGNLQNLAVFDANGEPLSCQLAKWLRLAYLRKTYELKGAWLTDEDAWRQPVRNAFEFNSIWRFDLPHMREGESPAGVSFNWHSTLNNVGGAQFVARTLSTTPESYFVQRIDLLDGQRDVIAGHVYGNINGQNLHVVWPPNAELRFSRTPDELSIDSPTLQTLMVRHWINEAVGDPGWIVFYGNGKVPYRVQIGRETKYCSGVANDHEGVEDDDWPPEVKMAEQIVGAKRLGK